MAKPKIDRQTLAQEYGWALAVLNSDSELRHLFNQAVANTWSADEFTARVRNTRWFQDHTQQQRQNQVLKATDPAEYQRRLQQTSDTIRQVAGSLGIDSKAMSSSAFNALVQHAFDNGWDSNEIQQHLAAGVNWTNRIAASSSAAGALDGQAATVASDIRQTAAAYGVNVSNHFIGSHVENVLANGGTKDGYLNYFKDVAKSIYPAYAKQIDAGYTMDQIAEPYRQSMASILELNPQSLGLSDPTLRKALTTTDPKTGEPVATPVWQFENTLRNDPRWQQTNNARDTYANLTAQLGNDWGVM